MPGAWEADVVLADGGSAHLRPVRPEDRPALEHLYESLSDDSRYLRFFSSVSGQEAGRIGPQVDVGDDHFALVVEAGGEVLGVADYFRTHADLAECAFTVRDDQQGRGLGTILLDHLAEIAVVHGIRCFVAQVLARNTAMRSVFTAAGFEIHASHAHTGVTEVVLDLTRTDAWRAAHAAREHTAESRSIAQLVAPRSVAVIGASRRRDAIGNAVLRNLVEGGFAGPVYPVNPHATEVEGLQAAPSVSAVVEPVDLAVIAVPAAVVEDVVLDCARKGVRDLVVVSGGFAEAGAGIAQARLRSLARANGMRVVGPNCVGIVNTAPGASLNATFAPVTPIPGVVGCGSDSGGIGIELLAQADERDLGVSTFVSLGNKADVSGNDLLQYWDEDERTGVIVLYLESFGNPRKFSRLARNIARRKPILALKSGRSAAGSRAASSHTAALASSDVAVDELFRQAGVVRVDTLEELLDAAALFAHQPLPAGRRVAIVTNGGGPGILASDACSAAGLEVPELSAPLQESLRTFAAPGAALGNPVDLIAGASAAMYERAVRAVRASGEVDALLVLYVSPFVSRPEDIERAIVRGVDDDLDVPTAACFLGVDVPRGSLRGDADGSAVPLFRYPESAANALDRAARVAEWRRTPRLTVPPLEGVDLPAARDVVRAALDRDPTGGWLEPGDAVRLVAAAGIPVLATRVAGSVAEAVQVAEELGYPVAVKAVAPGLVHKSDVGGVRLGVEDAAEVRAVFAELDTALAGRLDGVLVQPMAPAGVELIVGITHDAHFGPLVLLGMGGVAAELIRDTALRLVPLTALDARDMVRSLRTSPLLFGYRGAHGVDVTAVEESLLRMAILAEIPEITELECNPIIAAVDGVSALDVRVRIQPVAAPEAFALEP